MYTYRRHKNKHNTQKIKEMSKSVIGKFWNRIDSDLPLLAEELAIIMQTPDG